MTKTIQESLASRNTQQSEQPIQYIDTIAAYNKWAKIYDTDGNFLQALDSIEIRSLLPGFLALVRTNPTPNPSSPIKLVDLGCGTGRNTLQLLSLAPETDIVGLDASSGMLEVATRTIQQALSPCPGDNHKLPTLELYDLLQTPPSPPECSHNADGVISTLVLEHIPLPQFFETVSAILKPSGYLLLTNMHSEMGEVSQAGFVDPESGIKIRPTSYCHRVRDVVEVAGREGFEVVQ
ncbi:Methyltransferase small domain-containing protein, partial [Aspergillus sclerotialis]